jgi:hypothetical protein
MGASLGNVKEGSYSGKRVLGQVSLPIGAQLGRGRSTGNFESQLKGFWLWSISLYESSVRGTWRGDSFAGDPLGYERKALETGICLHGAQLGNLEMAHLTRTLRYG